MARLGIIIKIIIVLPVDDHREDAYSQTSLSREIIYAERPYKNKILCLLLR
jgi:hypothetical protein